MLLFVTFKTKLLLGPFSGYLEVYYSLFGSILLNTAVIFIMFTVENLAFASYIPGSLSVILQYKNVIESAQLVKQNLLTTRFFVNKHV